MLKSRIGKHKVISIFEKTVYASLMGVLDESGFWFGLGFFLMDQEKKKQDMEK